MPIRDGGVHAIRARTRAQIESTQIVCPRPHRTRGGQIETARGNGLMRLVTVRQDAPEWVIPQFAALLTGLTKRGGTYLLRAS
jgi:hypothetical protein